MAKLYNRRDILQECNKRLKALRAYPGDGMGLDEHLQNIYRMLEMLANESYKQESK